MSHRPFIFFLGSLVLGVSVSASTGEDHLIAGKSVPLVEGRYLKLGFNVLASYKFVPPELDPGAAPNATPPSAADQIPKDIKQLDGETAMVTGFMLPIKMEKGFVKEFLLVKDQMMCCYGNTPQMNEWVVVKMPNEGIKAVMDVPVSFYGKLHVKEMYENGYMTGLYSLDGEKMAP